MPKNLLQQYFPMLQTREALQKKIEENPVLRKKFHTWKLSQQKEEQALYEKLEREGKHEELMRVIRDEAYRRELLKKK